MPSVFLSHSSKDKFFARELAARLQAKGVKVWLDEVELRVGDSLTQKIGSAIEENDYLAVVLSRHSVNSEWVQKELQVALQKEFREKRVVVLPLLLEPVEMPPFLRDKLYADFSDPARFDEALPKVLKAVGVPEKDIPKPAPPSAEMVKPKPTSEAQRRLETFQDIRMEDLDLSRSYNPDPSKLLMNMYLRLSDPPPSEWREIFDAKRRFPRHTMWRSAWTEGQFIVIYCVPEELEKYHLRDLREDVTNANSKFRSYLAEVAKRESAKAREFEDKENELRDLRNRLDFS